jgi:replication-associated recombination protein RarA
VLTEKYRPRRIADLRGQSWATDQLALWLETPCPAVFLFSGGTGTGKTSAAVCLANELGVAVDEAEFGGFYQIASGEQTGESVRRAMAALATRPFMGSGWKVLVVNEADALTPGAAYVWLDALENLPAQTVVIFTTNNAGKLPRRLVDRCEHMQFEASALLIRQDLQSLACEVWRSETGRGDCPEVEEFGPLGDENGDASFRRLLQAMEPAIRAAKAGRTIEPRKVESRAVILKLPDRTLAAKKAWETRRANQRKAVQA